DAPASSAEHLQRDLAAGPRRAVVARQSNALPQLAQSTTLACLHESLGLHGGCRTNQRRGRLFVGLPQGDGFGVNHLGREGPARADWAALTTSANSAIVRFVQAVWFVRQPPWKAEAVVPAWET